MYVLLKNKFKRIMKYINGLDYNEISCLDDFTKHIYISEAIISNNLSIVKLFSQKNTITFTVFEMNFAALHGNLNIIIWLHKNRFEGCTTKAMDMAASYGHLNVVRWLHENRSEGCTTYAMDWAAYYGDIKMLKWLHKNRFEGFSETAFENARANKQHNCITYLNSINSENKFKQSWFGKLYNAFNFKNLYKPT